MTTQNRQKSNAKKDKTKQNNIELNKIKPGKTVHISQKVPLKRLRFSKFNIKSTIKCSVFFYPGLYTKRTNISTGCNICYYMADETRFDRMFYDDDMMVRAHCRVDEICMYSTCVTNYLQYGSRNFIQ